MYTVCSYRDPAIPPTLFLNPVVFSAVRILFALYAHIRQDSKTAFGLDND